MRRKVLQDYANKVCEIFTGWRLAVESADIPRLIGWSEGVVEIDLLTGNTRLAAETVPTLGIAEELTAWLRERCRADGVSLPEIREAKLRVRFQAFERTTRRGAFERTLRFSCRSMIATDERAYEGELDTDEAWSRSSSEGPWWVVDR